MNNWKHILKVKDYIFQYELTVIFLVVYEICWLRSKELLTSGLINFVSAFLNHINMSWNIHITHLEQILLANFTCLLFYDSFNIYNINNLTVTDFVFFQFHGLELLFLYL